MNMFNPLIERHDYGICDQVERQMIELQNQGLLPKELYIQNKKRIENCREKIDSIQHRAKQQAMQIKTSNRIKSL